VTYRVHRSWSRFTKCRRLQNDTNFTLFIELLFSTFFFFIAPTLYFSQCSDKYFDELVFFSLSYKVNHLLSNSSLYKRVRMKTTIVTRYIYRSFNKPEKRKNNFAINMINYVFQVACSVQFRCSSKFLCRLCPNTIVCNVTYICQVQFVAAKNKFHSNKTYFITRR